MATVTLDQVQTIVKTMADTAEENRKYFSDLDAVMGDGDFGESISCGFRQVMKDWDSYDISSIGPFFMGITRSITSSTGGCTGTVWGTLFMRMGMVLKDKVEFTLTEAAVECKETTKGWIAKRGRQFFTSERSIGTYDPGIVAVGVMATNIVEAMK